MSIEGVAVTNPGNVPGVRKKIPIPFSRPRVDLDGGVSVKRAWDQKAVHTIAEGDTVAGFGKVGEVVEFIKTPDLGLTEGDVIWRIRLYNVMGDYQDYPGEHQVLAFVPVQGDD